MVESNIREKSEKLKKSILEKGSVAVAFSGGVDSTFLLKVAHEVLGDKCIAVTAKSPAFPKSEHDDTVAFCREENIRQIIIDSGELELEEYRSNPKDRCYFCKRHIFTKILGIAEENGIDCVAEGSNMDDDSDYRPGHKAIKELGIFSPLRNAGLYKSEIRELSKEYGLRTWNKQSFACLASRFPYGETINEKKLAMVAKAEEILRANGFVQYRVRIHELLSGKGYLARIEVPAKDISRLVSEPCISCIRREFRKTGFSYITADMDGYRTGSMNEVL